LRCAAWKTIPPLKLWFIIRSFGVGGMICILREHCRLAREFALWVDADPDFERLAPIPFSVVCFRYHPKEISDEGKLEQMNTQIIDRINMTGEAFLSHTKLNDRYTIRLAIGNLATAEKHVARVWELLKQESAKL
jgi:aromatic-L-amino-acid decarboxylase